MRCVHEKSLKCRFIKDHQQLFAVRSRCRVLEVSVSSYYAWTQRSESNRSKESLTLTRHIREIFDNSHQTYGNPRIAATLWRLGLNCSRCREARLMRRMGIRSRMARKFKITTDSNHQEPVSPNLLEQDFSAQLPNTVWTSDITYLRTESGWQYLTVILELFNREIIGYSLSSRVTTETTVIPALDMAVLHRQPRAEGSFFIRIEAVNTPARISGKSLRSTKWS
ncbi:MAG: IS3 family transposase [Chlorobiaceae bacterium]|nr:IS3 family transposase [Chlorobiaceae bacterium]